MSGTYLGEERQSARTPRGETPLTDCPLIWASILEVADPVQIRGVR